jgi:hypothetical protein
VRPETLQEKTFCALGPDREAFITGAAAAGHTRLGPELTELNPRRSTWRAGLPRRLARES